MHFLCEQCKHLLGGNRNFPCQCGEYYLTSYIFKVSHNSYPCMHHFQYIPAPKHSERSIIYFMFLILWKFLLFRTTFNFPIFERWKLKSWVKSHFGKICTSKFLQVPLHEGRCAGQESAIIIIKEKSCKNNPHKCCPKCPFPCSVAIQLVVWKQELDPSLKWEQKAAWWP